MTRFVVGAVTFLCGCVGVAAVDAGDVEHIDAVVVVATSDVFSVTGNNAR